MNTWTVYLKSGATIKVVSLNKEAAFLTAFELSPDDKPVRAVLSDEW